MRVLSGVLGLAGFALVAVACAGGQQGVKGDRPPPDAPADDVAKWCARIDNCGMCASEGRCGWCGGEQRCAYAAEGGPAPTCAGFVKNSSGCGGQ